MQNEIATIFSKLNQEHLIDDLNHFNDLALSKCLNQLNEWKIEKLEQQKKSWSDRKKNLVFEPLLHCPMAHDQVAQFSKKKAAVILLAGGQGSRLGINGPKGCFSILGKSLFEWHAEKIRLEPLPLAVMTSTINHLETVAFFKQHHFFGLSDVCFFSQKTLPLFDEKGRWFWQAKGWLAEGADGNGSVFQAFEEAGLLQRFQNAKVELIHFIPVDNPLADPHDPLLSAYHIEQNAELTIKCIRLSDPYEPMGRIVLKGKQHQIAEFAEMTDEQRNENLMANTGLLAMDGSLMHRLAFQEFPIHWAFRSIFCWENGQLIQKKAWKAERFIVDALDFTQKSCCLCYERDACYAPLKEKNSIAQIERLLEKNNRV